LITLITELIERLRQLESFGGVTEFLQPVTKLLSRPATPQRALARLQHKERHWMELFRG
jgi:hypothetical protein